MARTESQFQSAIIKSLRQIFSDCIVLKNDSSYLQGVPDLIVLCGNKWAALECKIDADAPRQPNQDHYVTTMNDMSYAAIIHPGNKDKVFDDLQSAFRTRRAARIPEAKLLSLA